VYVVVGRNGIEGLEEGVFRYLPERHAIEEAAAGDQRSKVAGASVGQDWIAQAPAILVITAEYQRITGKYGERGVRYALIEVGHVGQNIFLQAGALGLGAGIVGAFDDDRVAKAIGAQPKHEPLLIMPVGYKK
jgi:SagB-type dehydrogenase family enzyme